MTDREPDGRGSGGRSNETDGTVLPVGRTDGRFDVPPRWGWLAVGLALVAVVRLLPWRRVFRDGAVVLSSNDPYFYRFWVDRVTAHEAGPLDLLVSPGPAAAFETGEPLLIYVLSAIVETLGGGSGIVLAAYPVVAALVTGAAVHSLATELTDDSRIGLAALGLFAVAPGHAFRTGLGFADHHAFDYVWLTLTALALVKLFAADGKRRRWTLTGLLGVAVAGGTLAWEGSPILLAPLAVGIAGVGVLTVRAGSPSDLLSPTLGIGLGAVIVAAVHAALGWQATAVAAAPAALFFGSGAVAVSALIADRIDLHPLGFAALAGAVLAGGTALLGGPVAVAGGRFQREVAFLLDSANIAETTSLLNTFGVLVGPVVMLGFALFFALPVMAWAIPRAYDDYDPGLLVVAAYAWCLLGLSVLQRRFTGELAPFVAALGGIAAVGLASWFGLVRTPEVGRRRADPAPDGGAGVRKTGIRSADRRQFLGLAGLSVLFGGFPALFTAKFHDEVAVDPDAYRAARRMARYANQRDLDYPDSYVFSSWGENRMYNYFVNGRAKSYAFARRNYGTFLLSNDPGEWYESLRDRAGFVVVERLVSDLNPSATYVRLYEHFGSAAGDVPAVGHYRGIYASPDGAVKAFALVPGARIAGTAPGDAVSIATEVSIPNATFTYERRVETDDAGAFSAPVPYPGTYRVGDATVRVPESAVRNGETIRISRDDGEGEG